MWLDGVNARVATEVRELLGTPLALNEPERQHLLAELLQDLSLHLAGRNVASSEVEYVWQGGAPAFEGLLRLYRDEQLNFRGAPVPGNVVPGKVFFETRSERSAVG